MEVKALKELGKELNVLYIEDEAMIRQQMEDILKNLFKSVTTAVNGQEGVDLFTKGKYDIVITDIQMPIKNGLEAAKEIKQMSPHTPIVVTTAYSDANLFMTSIELGIERYILKPISVPNLFGSLQSVAEALINKRKAEELRRKMLLEEINETASGVAQSLADAFPMPSVAFGKDKLKFVNQAFAELFGEEFIKQMQSHQKTLCSLFEKRDGFLSSLQDIDPNDHQANRVIITIDGKKNIFLIAKREITILKERIEIYTLSNITQIEYQKIKSKNYADLLEDMLLMWRKNQFLQKTTQQTQQFSAPNTATISKTETEAEPREPQKEFFVLNEEEKALLRKSHLSKYTAAEYCASLGDELIDEIEEFVDLESEFKELVEEFQDSANWLLLEKFAAIFRMYAKTISKLIEFEDLAYAINSLPKIITEADPTDDNRAALTLFLDNIRIDLAQWREKIFIEKSAKDIHYLDSSFFSSCLQLQLKLGSASIETEDNDLELF